MPYINSLAFFQLTMAIKNKTFLVGKAKLENKLQNLMPELGLGDNVNILYILSIFCCLKRSIRGYDISLRRSIISSNVVLTTEKRFCQLTLTVLKTDKHLLAPDMILTKS